MTQKYTEKREELTEKKHTSTKQNGRQGLKRIDTDKSTKNRKQKD